MILSAKEKRETINNHEEKHGQTRLLSFPRKELLEPELSTDPSLDEFQMGCAPKQHISNQEIRAVYEPFYLNLNVLGAEKNERTIKQFEE